MTDSFDTLSMFLKDLSFHLTQNMEIFFNHLLQLYAKFRKYFPETEQYHRISDPFNADPPSNFTNTEEEQQD